MVDIEKLQTRLSMLEAQVRQLQAESDIRRVMARYMLLCDWPTPAVDGVPFEDLFTEDIVWEGIGPRYARDYGRHEGHQKVLAFFNSFKGSRPAFQMNVHHLASEAISVTGDTARGQWVLFQASTAARHQTRLRGARLNIALRFEAQKWRIAHFTTEYLFQVSFAANQVDIPLPQS